MLKVYNTLSRKKEIFRPLHDKKVGLYTCGPTVYWFAHIGNLRTYIFEDILKKYKTSKRKNLKLIAERYFESNAFKEVETVLADHIPFIKELFLTNSRIQIKI